MKRITASALALVLLLILCACGASTPAETATPSSEVVETDAVEEAKMTKEEMLAGATATTMEDIDNASVENIAKAKQLYCDKVLLLEGSVLRIEEDYIILGDLLPVYEMRVYLPLDDLVNLTSGQEITVVVKTEPEIKEEVDVVNGTTFTTKCYEALQAYLVKDTIEWTCKLDSKSESYEGAYNVKVDGSSVLKLVYFAADAEIPAMGTTVKVEGKRIAKNVGGGLFDAHIIEILE